MTVNNGIFQILVENNCQYMGPIRYKSVICGSVKYNGIGRWYQFC